MQPGQGSGKLRPAAGRSRRPRPSARRYRAGSPPAAGLPALRAHGASGTVRWP